MKPTKARHCDKKKGGFVLLIVLIAVAIGLLIYYSDLSAIFHKSLEDESDENLSLSKLQEQLEAKSKGKLLFSKDQPPITETLKFEVSTKQKDKPRGVVEIVIEPNGDVWGRWRGSYLNSEKADVDIIEASFEGRLYPSKRYKDEYGYDPSRIFFLTKGRFLLTEKNFNKNKLEHQDGDIYVTGWIDQDYIISGKVSLVRGEEVYKIFAWDTKRPAKQ